MSARKIAAVSGLGMILGCTLEASGPTELRGEPVTVSFQDGVAPSSSYTGTRDTMLEQNAPKSAHGGDGSLSVSGDTPGGSGKDDVALLRWDLSATIPADAVVSAASITLAVSDKASQSYELHEVLRPWTESQATWNVAASGAPWASAGGKGAGDRGVLVLGSITAAATGSYTIDLNAGGVAVVQRWVHDPVSNLGVFVADGNNDNRLEFRASEYGTKSARPRLTVSWELAADDTDTTDTDPGDPYGLLQTPGHYRGTCDGSGAVALEGGYFLDFNDENQVLRIYAQGSNAAPVQSLDINAGLGLSPGEEADLEDAARVGDRVYVLSSHARNKDGELQTSRYRFFALDLAGAVPGLTMHIAGVSSHLLADMLDAGNWAAPNASIIALLQSTSQLSKGTVASLAPKLEGANIEGLAALGDSGVLVIGLRNPRSSSKAILVTLLNADAVIGGAKARLGEAIVLDLAGQTIRGMAWSDSHQSMFLLGGPRDEAQGPFALWRWNGPGAAAVKVTDIVAPAAAGPEAIIAYPGTKDLQVLFDMGRSQIGGGDCKAATPADQFFTDTIIHVN